MRLAQSCGNRCNAPMIRKIPYEVWWCSACLTVWLPRRGQTKPPARCPNRKCRKWASWQGATGRKAEVLAKVTQTHARPIEESTPDPPSSPEYSCPYCEDPLEKVVKRGPHFGKYGCPECNHLWTEAELARVIDHPRTQQRQRV